jgi:TetR/AcrR family transcriptional regulator, ethionamide resistance regulator
LTRKTNSHPSDKGRRRRRKPEAAESEILNAAEQFLREHPLRDMTIDDIMSRTGLSRPSFYEYFRDRNQLIIKLAERLGAQNAAIAEKWIRSDRAADDLRPVTEQTVGLAVTHGHLLRALADAANGDREVEATYRQEMQAAVDRTAQRIRGDAGRGLVNLDGLDAKHLATALIHMNSAYIIETMGRRPQADPKVVAETLIAIWTRVLFGPSR